MKTSDHSGLRDSRLRDSGLRAQLAMAGKSAGIGSIPTLVAIAGMVVAVALHPAAPVNAVEAAAGSVSSGLRIAGGLSEMPGERFARVAAVRGPLKVTREEWEYLTAVALSGSELGDAQGVLHRWAKDHPITVWIGGEPTLEDAQAALRALDRVRTLTGLRIVLTNRESEAVFRIYIVNDHQRFRGIFEGSPIVTESTIRRNQGLFELAVTGPQDGGEIVSARVAVTRTTMAGVPLPRRTVEHLLVEEITQAFGPVNDSPRYPDSVFQADPTLQPVTLSPLDARVLKIIYQLPLGVTASEAARHVDIQG